MPAIDAPKNFVATGRDAKSSHCHHYNPMIFSVGLPLRWDALLSVSFDVDGK